MKKGTNELRVFRKEENGMAFRVEMNEHSTLVTKITKKDTVVYDDSKWLLVCKNNNSTLVIRCNSADEAEDKYNSMEYKGYHCEICRNELLVDGNNKLDHYIKFMEKKCHLCNGDCGNTPICGHPLAVFICEGFSVEDMKELKERNKGGR